MWWDGQRHFPKKAVTMFCIAKCELQSDADGKSEGDGDPSSALRCKALWLCHCTAAGCYQLSLDSWLSSRVLLGPAPPQCTQAMQPLLVQGFWCGVQWGHSYTQDLCLWFTVWRSLSLLQGVSYSPFRVLWLSCQPCVSRHHQVWALLVWAELAVQEANLNLLCLGKGQLFPFHLCAGMRWQIYVMPIKIFYMVFNLNILAETIIHLSCLYNINIQYMAASPWTELLFCITQTLRLHIVFVLPFYPTKVTFCTDRMSGIWFTGFACQCIAGDHRPGIIAEWANAKDTDSCI